MPAAGSCLNGNSIYPKNGLLDKAENYPFCAQGTDKLVEAPRLVIEAQQAPKNGPEASRAATEREDGASTPESGEISEPEALAKEVANGPSNEAGPLGASAPANGHPIATSDSPKRKHEADR
jgi:hypothetical protein